MISIFLSVILLLPQYSIPQATGAIASSAAATVTFVKGNGATYGSSTITTATVTLTGVSAGDLMVGCLEYSSSGDTFTSFGDGTSTFTALSSTTDGVDDFGRAAYLLASVATGGVTYTGSWVSGASNIDLVIYEFHTTAGTWHYDASNQNAGVLTTAVTTGAITTTGSAEAISFCNKLAYDAATASNPLVNGVTPVEPSFSPVNTYDHYYYYLPTGAFVAGQGTLTYSTNTYWVTEIAAFSAH